MPEAARGIRNNNPGNIRLGRTAWQGQVPPEQQTDPAYTQFIAPEWGLRAIVHVLEAYRLRGLFSIRQMISTWAPPSDDNPTEAYVEHVALAAGCAPDLPLTAAEFHAALPDLLAAIVKQENGVQPYGPEILQHAISLA